MHYTTLNKLKAINLSLSSYKHLCKALGGIDSYGKDTPLPYLNILEINGINDALLALDKGNETTRRVLNLFALKVAEHVAHLFTEAFPEDTRVSESLSTTRLFINGKATTEELKAALTTSQAAAAEAWAAAEACAASHAAVAEAAWAAAGFAADAWEEVEYIVLTTSWDDTKTWAEAAALTTSWAAATEAWAEAAAGFAAWDAAGFAAREAVEAKYKALTTSWNYSEDVDAARAVAETAAKTAAKAWAKAVAEAEAEAEVLTAVWEAAGFAARAASWAATTVDVAADAAAGFASWGAARTAGNGTGAARTAGNGTGAARASARAAADTDAEQAAREAERQWQVELLINMLENGE